MDNGYLGALMVLMKFYTSKVLKNRCVKNMQNDPPSTGLLVKSDAGGKWWVGERKEYQPAQSTRVP